MHESVFNTYETQINTKEWVPGIYIIKVHAEGHSPVVQKLIVK